MHRFTMSVCALIVLAGLASAPFSARSDEALASSVDAATIRTELERIYLAEGVYFSEHQRYGDFYELVRAETLPWTWKVEVPYPGQSLGIGPSGTRYMLVVGQSIEEPAFMAGPEADLSLIATPQGIITIAELEAATTDPDSAWVASSKMMATSLLHYLQRIQGDYFAKNQRYADLKTLAAAGFDKRLVKSRSHSIMLKVVPAADGSSFQAAVVVGGGIEFQLDAQGNMSEARGTKAEVARNTTRSVVSAQAAYYAANGKYGTVAELVAPPNYLTDPATWSGLTLQLTVGADGQSYKVKVAADDGGPLAWVFESDEGGRLREANGYAELD
jgi:hypothetical protein